MSRAGLYGPWPRLLPLDVAKRSIAVARDIGARIGSDNCLSYSLTGAKGSQSSIRPPLSGLARGYAGLALACGHFDRCFPRECWDEPAHDHLERSIRIIEVQKSSTLGLFGGLCGVAFTAQYLNHRKRYTQLIRSLDALIYKTIPEVLEEYAYDKSHASSEFDLVSGLTGIGVYLLMRKQNENSRTLLKTVLRVLIDQTNLGNFPLGWHTSPESVEGRSLRQMFPDGCVNLGLAHGIPGPLALMAISKQNGVTPRGMNAAMQRLGDWLISCQCSDEWGINWPVAVPVSRSPLSPHQNCRTTPSRGAWCYGAPGIARTLWLLGRAMCCSTYCDCSLAALKAVYSRPYRARQLNSPMFCHGLAGVLQITVRTARDAGLQTLKDSVLELTNRILHAYDRTSVYGFRSEGHGPAADDPSVLEGVAGTALALMSAAVPIEPTWDRLFLIS